jgi:hypothetical protein
VVAEFEKKVENFLKDFFQITNFSEAATDSSISRSCRQHGGRFHLNPEEASTALPHGRALACGPKHYNTVPLQERLSYPTRILVLL